MSLISEERKAEILGKWSDGLDLCTDSPGSYDFNLLGHTCSANPCADLAQAISPGKGLPPFLAERADKYIRALALAYPFQLRRAYAFDRWHEFLYQYSRKGDFEQAMRVL